MRAIWSCMLVAVTACTGCVNAPFAWPGAKPASATAPARAKGPPSPVSADEITDANAHEKAQALHEELDRAASETTAK